MKFNEDLKFSRKGKGFERRTIFAKKQIRFFMWLNKFYYR